MPLLIKRHLLARIGNLKQLLGRKLVDDLCELLSVNLCAALALDTVGGDELSNIGLGKGSILHGAHGSVDEVITTVLSLLKRLDTDLKLEKVIWRAILNPFVENWQN